MSTFMNHCGTFMNHCATHIPIAQFIPQSRYKTRQNYKNTKTNMIHGVQIFEL